MMQIALSVLIGCMLGVSVHAADPFVGTWVWNAKQMQFDDVKLEIQDAGTGQYRFLYADGGSVTLADNGKEIAKSGGGTASLQKIDGRTWKLVNKRSTNTTQVFRISSDAQILDESEVRSHPNGETAKSSMHWRRVGATKGLIGVWKLNSYEDSSSSSVNTLEIKPFKENGLSFYAPADKDLTEMMFDGKDYEDKGPNVPKGTTSSGKRIDEYTLEVTDKLNGKLSSSEVYKVSPDRKSMTLTVKYVRNDKPVVAVYVRQ